MLRFSMAIAGVFGMAALTAGPAQASLIGENLHVAYAYPDVLTPYASAVFTPSDFRVTAGQDTVGTVEGVTSLDVGFAPARLAITFETRLDDPTWNSVAFNGPVFTAGSPLGIASATIDPATTMDGFDASRISFSGDQILLNWQGLSYHSGTVVAVDFGFIPEPASFLLLGTGLVGAGLVRRRRTCAPPQAG